MKQTLLFDLDGTLTDSQPGILNCIRYALTKLGQPWTGDDTSLNWCVGPPLYLSFGRLLETEDRALIELAVSYYRERFREIGWAENSVYPGIAELLTALVGRGHKLFVATSKPRVFAERILQHFSLAPRFVRIHGSELDGRLSDKAELIGHVLETENLLSAEVVMIGDREHDIIGAVRHRLVSIGALWGYGSEPELLNAGATHVVRSPDEILALV